jgi:hypothetical protein
MEDWIGILLVVLMIPGLLLLIGVVLLAVFHLKGSSEPIMPPADLANSIPLTRLTDPLIDPLIDPVKNDT